MGKREGCSGCAREGKYEQYLDINSVLYATALALRFGGMPSAVRPHGTGHRLKIRECWARRGVPIAPDDKTICGFHVGIAPQSSGDTELFLSGKSECQGKRGGVSGLQG
eukprot:1177510-Prorocentrum_minimum.AAC.2